MTPSDLKQLVEDTVKTNCKIKKNKTVWGKWETATRNTNRLRWKGDMHRVVYIYSVKGIREDSACVLPQHPTVRLHLREVSWDVTVFPNIPKHLICVRLLLLYSVVKKQEKSKQTNKKKKQCLSICWHVLVFPQIPESFFFLVVFICYSQDLIIFILSHNPMKLHQSRWWIYSFMCSPFCFG